jgi:hypothetical protein
MMTSKMIISVTDLKITTPSIYRHVCSIVPQTTKHATFQARTYELKECEHYYEIVVWMGPDGFSNVTG